MAVEFGEPLSKRERDVWQELASGSSNKDIAEALFISPNTVKVHVRNIRTKLGATSRTEAVTKGIQLNVVEGFRIVEPVAPIEPEPIPKPDPPEPEVSPVAKPDPVQPAPVLANNVDVVSPPIEVEAVSAPVLQSADSPKYLSVVLFSMLLIGVVFVGWFIIPEMSGEGLPAMDQPQPTVELDATGWFEAQSVNVPVSRHTLSSIGGELYLISGETESGVSAQTLRYKTTEFVWESRADKPTPVRDAASVVIQGQIYVVGGQLEDGSYTNHLEVYSPLGDLWRSASAMPLAAGGGVALVSGDLLYYIGGESEAGPLRDVFVYDPSADGWRPLPSLADARSYAAGGVLANSLVVAGGLNESGELRSCERFDLNQVVWEPCADMLTPRAGASANAIFNELHVLGGGVTGAVSHGEIYDSDRDEWKLLNMPTLDPAENYTHLKTATIETNIYIVGGERDGVKQNTSYIYKTLPFQFFVPAATNN
ncbi:MAG: Kelch repeat-containing protein [Candidatus Promineifilaceae bacterium]